MSTDVRINSRELGLPSAYELDPEWPHTSGPEKLKQVSNIAVDTNDLIWTLNRGRMPVQVFTAEGRFLFGWGKEVLKVAHGLKIDPEGNIWIGDAFEHVIYKFTPRGKLLLTIGTPGQPGEDETHFNRPTDIAVSPAGEIFVSDGYRNNRIVHYDPQGKFVKTWGKKGLKPGELNLPHTIAIDSRGLLYVTERNNARIQVFDQEGRSLSLWPDLCIPWGMWLTPGDEILVCGSSPMEYTGFKQEDRKMLGVPPKDQLVLKFDTCGRLLELWSFPMTKKGVKNAGTLNWVHGIANDSKGDLYLGDVLGNRVQKFIRLPAGR